MRTTISLTAAFTLGWVAHYVFIHYTPWGYTDTYYYDKDYDPCRHRPAPG